MGFFSADLEPMIELYQRETAELMEEFDARLTRAVQENAFSEQDINAVFRVVHTIKSSAAMMGLPDISGSTHKMEDLFLLFRDKPERMKGHENRVFDLMYTFSDYIGEENSRVSHSDFYPGNADGLVAAIQKEIDFFSAKENDDTKEQMKSDEEEAARPAAKPENPVHIPIPEGGETVWQVRLHPNCQMENVRAFMLVRQIQDLCQKIATVPADLEGSESAGQISRDGLHLILHTNREDEVEKRLSASPYVLSVKKIGQSGGRNPSASEAGRKEGQGQAREDSLSSRQNKFSMVSWDHVMRLQNITGELITANTILGASLKNTTKDGNLDREFQTMKRLFQDLEKLVAAVSMMPVSSVSPQYYRLVRDVAGREGKQIRLKIIGEELEVDRNLLDTQAKPLVHLLRNAADHGIESPEVRAATGKDPSGTVTLKFENLTDHLRVTVEDDGAGMDTQRLLKKAAERGILTKGEDQYTTEEILNIAFLPGMSTNEQVNQYSGRGVGMDVAQSVVSNLGGSVTVNSELGKGTSIMMEVPVSVTSAECVKFKVGAYTCLLPIRYVVRIYRPEEVDGYLQFIDGRMWFQESEMLPVLDLFDLFGEKARESERLIVIRDARGKAALLTGPVSGQQTAVEKPLPDLLDHHYRTRTGIIGCTVTETGKLGMMLNADWLIRMCGREVAEDGNEQ